MPFEGQRDTPGRDSESHARTAGFPSHITVAGVPLVGTKHPPYGTAPA